MNWRRHAALLALAVVVATAAVVIPVDRLVDAFAWIRDRPLVFLIALTLFALVRPFLLGPAAFLSIAAGYAYGPVLGIPVALVLLTISTVPPFLVGRRMVVRASAAGRVADRTLDVTGGLRGMVASRLAPVPADPVSVAAGVSSVRFRTFVTGTFLGEIPWAVVGVMVGASLGRLSSGAVADAFDPLVVLAGASLAFLVLAGPIYRFLRGRSRDSLVDLPG